MVNTSSQDTDTLLKLLDQGADYRFIDHAKSQKGYTFANMMQESGNTTLLKALKRKSGIHRMDDAQKDQNPQKISAPSPDKLTLN